MFSLAYRWIDRNVLELGREFRVSYLPPLMVYMAAGVSGLTNIVGTFFVKDYLGLSAEFLAALGFWAGIPWALKMPLGHLVDLIWRWKFILVFVGAGLITLSLGIMIGLLAYTDMMRQFMSVEAWYVISALLAPVLRRLPMIVRRSLRDSFSTAISSAAADGVGARRSAARSEMVTSTS